MTFAHISGLALAAVFALATDGPRQPPAADRTGAVVIEIAKPGKTGLAPGRYRVEADRASTAGKEPSGHVILTSTGVPAARHRYDARVTGCGSANIEVMPQQQNHRPQSVAHGFPRRRSPSQETRRRL